MQFKGLVVSVEKDPYTGSKGTLDNTIVTCLDAESVKLKNTVDVKIPTEDLKLCGNIVQNQTVIGFDVSDVEFFRNRARFIARVQVKKV